MMDDIEDGIDDIMGDGDNNDSDTVTNPQILFYKKREQQDKIACCSRF